MIYLPWQHGPWHAGLFVLLALLSAAIVHRMTSIGLLDQPNARSSHDRPTPKGGGVGVVAAVVAGALASLALGNGVFAPVMLVAAVLLAALAFADDARSFSFAVKLGAQVLAACAAVAAGVVLREADIPGLGHVVLGAWGIPVTLAWILFVTNAINFIDGLNGLASGVSLLTAFVLAALVPPGPVRAVCLSLAAGLAGFLPFNFPRARIFMADVGSQFCGYLLAVLAVAAASEGTSAFTGPLLLSGVLFDVLLTLVRRAIAGERVWTAHRGHLYQVARRSGIPAPAIAVLHWLFALWGGALAMLEPAWAVPEALAPQFAWAVLVTLRARRARIGRW